MRAIIIGNGIAGTTAARSMAECSAVTAIDVYSLEPYHYYPRPRLIGMLAGDIAPEDMPQYSPEWYRRRNIAVHLGLEAVSLEPQAHRVMFGNGQIEPYDRLILATGAHSWVPPIEGVDRVGVFTLRTLADAQAIQASVRRLQNVVCIGGGLLGLDTSMALARLGASVTILEALPRLLPRQLDEEGAIVLQRQIEASGARVLTGVTCEEIQGSERVQGVRLAGGEVLPADVVIVSAGVRSNIALAQRAALSCNRGIIVNERMQTNDGDIYAIGDCAEFNRMVWAIIPVALAQARVAAAQICGQEDVIYESVLPSTTLKVTGIDLTSIGEVNPEPDGCFEKRYCNPEGSVYEKLVIRNGHVVGAIVLGDRHDVRAVNQLIQQDIDVTPYLDELWRDGAHLDQIVKALA